MKKILATLLLLITMIGCTNDNNTSNPSLSTGNVDYEFTVTINGVVHKVKGNTKDGEPNGYRMAPFQVNNTSYFSSLSTISTVILGINDVSEINFVSGQILRCGINFPNLSLGVNQAEVGFQGSYTDSMIGLYFQTTSGEFKPNNHNILPITITDLGTGNTGFFPNKIYGKTIKGNYSGIIFKQGNRIGSNGYYIYDVPISLSIDFKALRIN